MAVPVMQPQAVGLLTSEHRDTWSALHVEMEKASLALS
jgi:hypothetical protein